MVSWRVGTAHHVFQQRLEWRAIPFNLEANDGGPCLPCKSRIGFAHTLRGGR